MAPTLTRADIDPEAVEAELADASPEEALGWAAEQFPNLSIACSFQKTTSATVDMASRVAPNARFF